VASLSRVSYAGSDRVRPKPATAADVRRDFTLGYERLPIHLHLWQRAELLQFCVTVNGNITEFQSPVGFEHIREGSFGEGYGICDFSNLNRFSIGPTLETRVTG
jgi:hypothetical protein